MNKFVSQRKTQAGFTLIELMIVIAIVGILAAVALPSYQNYTKRAKFSEVIAATSPAKLAIDLCFQSKGDITACNSPTEAGVIVGDLNGGNYVTSVGVTGTTSAIITATGAAPFSGATYILEATVSGASIVWAPPSTPGTCAGLGLC